MSEIDDVLDMSLDDMLGDLGGVDTRYAQMSPEEKFYHDLTTGKHTKLYNARYWLNHELSVYNTLLSKGYLVVKPHREHKVSLSIIELAKGLLEHYFLMSALSRFDKTFATPARPQCDMDKFLALVLENEEIKRTIKQYSS